MLDITTGNAFKTKSFRLDGESFTLSPLGAGSFVKLMSIQPKIKRLQEGDLSPAELQEVQDLMLALVDKSVSPAKEWEEWKTMAMQVNEIAFWTVINTLFSEIAEGVKINRGGKK